MAGKRTGPNGPLLKEGLFSLLPCIFMLCGGAVVAKECMVKPESSLRLPGWCMSDVASSTGELLNNVNRLRTGNNAQLPQAEAIPLPPSYSLPKLKSEAARGRARGAGVVEDLKMLDKSVRGLEKVRMEDVYEGSFNFAHPGYRWVDDVRAMAYYGEGGLGPKVTEDVQKIPGEGLDELVMLKAIGWGRARHRASMEAEKLHLEEKPAPPSEGIDWTLYSGIILCGPFFFGLLLYGLYVRFVRRSSISSSLDLGQELESDDDEIPPMEMRRSMANWRMLWRAILNSTESGGEDFVGGMSVEQIEKLPLVAHCDDGQCLSGPKFRCIICLSDVKKSEMLREIPCCGHRFHSTCVDPWLERSATCPLCRRDVVVQQQEDGDDAIQEEGPSETIASTGEPQNLDTLVLDSPTSSSQQAMVSEDLQNLDTLPDSPTPSSSRGDGVEGEDPGAMDLPSASMPIPSQDGASPGEDSALPRSFGAESSDMDEWSEPEAPGSIAGVEVDGWEIIDGGS